MIARLTKRSDFVAAASGRRFRTSRVTVQIRRRDAPGGPARVGFTVTKREGGAVERNRIKRRLRAAVAALATGEPGLIPGATDVVVIGRRDILHAAFPSLIRDIADALRRPGRGPRQAANPLQAPVQAG